MPTQRCPKCKGTGQLGDRLVVVFPTHVGVNRNEV